MGLDHMEKLGFEIHIFKKPLYYRISAKVNMLKNSPGSGEFFNIRWRVF
jgi:hypothetical protein